MADEGSFQPQPNGNDLLIIETSSKFTSSQPPETEQQRRPLPDSSLSTSRQKLPTQSGRICLVHSSDSEFCTDTSSCEGNRNQATRSYYPVCTLWYGICLCWRRDTIMAVHQLYEDVAYT